MNLILKENFIKRLLCFSVFFIFLGRAWQHLFWDAPYRTFFWDEALLKPMVEKIFSTPWYDYVTSETLDVFIQNLIFSTGLIYLIAAICSLFYHRFRNAFIRFFIFLGGVNLVLLSYLLMKDKFYHAAQFFEQSIQFSLPFVLLYVFSEKVDFKKVLLILKILIAIVFVSHGLYAVGYYPVPGKFVDMIIHISTLSEGTTKKILWLAGGIDFLIAVSIFIPKISKIALWYACAWGLLTAFARIVAGFQVDFIWQSIHQELYGTLFRLAHGLVPLCAVLLAGFLKGKTKN